MTATTSDIQRSLFAHSPTAVIAADLERRITGLNPAAEKLFGYSSGELEGRDTQIVYADPRDYERLGRTNYRSDIDAPTQTYTVKYRSRTGRIFDGETVGCPVHDDTGERIGFMCIIRDISDRLGLEARLEASDIQLRAALSSANEGTYSLNLVTGLGSIRGFINEFLGITAADATISRQRWLETLHPDDRETFNKALDQIARAPDTAFDIVYRSQRSDGEWRWLHNRGRVTEFTRDGAPLRISGVVSDVTDRQELEQKLAESERLLREAMNTTSEGAFRADLVTRTAQVTGIYCRLFGIDAEVGEISREAWLEHVHPDDLHIANEAWRTMLETGEADTSYRVADPDGGWMWINNRARVIERDETGTPLQASGLSSDITERKGLEQRLEDSERLLREALEGAEYGAWSMDLSAETLRVSGFLARLLGETAENTGLPLERVFGLMAPESAKQAKAAYARLLAGESVHMEYAFVLEDGSYRWIRDNGRVVEWNAERRPLRAAGVSADITEEKRLQSEVEESQRRLQEALHAAGEGTWRLNLRTRIADITGIISAFMGLPPMDARVTYDDWAERIHADDRVIADQSLEALRTGGSETVDFVIRYESEHDGWIRLHYRGKVSERDENGQPICVTGFMADITERLETAERLAEREIQLADAIDAASLGVWRVATDDGIMHVHGGIASQIDGDHPEIALKQEQWFDRVHPDDHAGLRDANLALLRGDTDTFDHTYRLILDSEDWIWVRVTGRVIHRDDEGWAKVASGVIQDIDEAKRLNDALSAERLRFEAIYRASPAMMHTINADGVIVDVSDYWLAHLGYDRDEVIGRRSVEFLVPESRDRAETINLPELFQTGRNANIPYRFIRKNGEVLDVLLSSFLERDRKGRPRFSYAVMTDITPLRAAYEQLERSNRELDRFATVASHDLQEPLRKISAFASLVRSRYSDTIDPEGQRCLDFLVDAAQRMQRLIDDLLAYSKMSSQPLKLEEFTLDDLVGEILDRLADSVETSKAKIELLDLPQIRGDRFLLGQALQNLISNALKYCDEDVPQIEIGSRADDSEWTIWIRDNGIGLEPRFADQIFAPFRRLHTREEYEGTGIGLAIVRQAVERLGGRIWVDSQPGQGAQFTFTLPRPQLVDLPTSA